MSELDELIRSQEAEIEAAKRRLSLLIELRDREKANSWVTAKSAAEQMGISVRTVPVWCNDGRLEGKRNGRNWYVSQASIDRLVGGF